MIQRSIQTIVTWEKEGLISPKRDDRGWRVFSQEDIQKMEEIKRTRIKHSLAGKPLEGEDPDGSG